MLKRIIGQPGKRRRRLVLLGVGAPLILATAAAAAWLLIGSGSTPFTETTGTAGSIAVVPVVGNLTDALTPGGPVGDMTATVPNPSGTNPIQLNHAPAFSVTGTSAGAACGTANFVITQPVGWTITSGDVTFPVALPVGAHLSTDGQATIQMIASAPTTCENVTVNLAVTVAP